MSLLAKICTLPVAALVLTQTALAGPMSVELNKTFPVHLRGKAASVVLGNPKIADVVVHDDRLLFVTGKSFGTTNLLVFDKEKRQIFSSEITVIADEANLVTVNRSGSNYTYDCAPDCRPTLNVGDEAGHFSQNMQQQNNLMRMTDPE